MNISIKHMEFVNKYFVGNIIFKRARPYLFAQSLMVSRIAI